MIGIEMMERDELKANGKGGRRKEPRLHFIHCLVTSEHFSGHLKNYDRYDA